jgi:hypothetical protein
MSKPTPPGPRPPAGAARPGGRPSAGPPHWMQNWKVMVPLWVGIIALVWLARRQHVGTAAIAGIVVIVGLLSNAFAWLLGIVAVVPIVGPLVVKVLSIGFIWLINAVGYLVSVIAIKRGYSKDVLTYRGVTIALIIGIIIGFVLGKLI